MRFVARARTASTFAVFAISVSFALAVPAAAQLPGQTPVDPDELRVATQVYEALARQFRDGRPAPEFRMGARQAQVATYRIAEATIELEAPAYRVARTFGADSLNALAYLLGHELAHYYMDHARRAGIEQWFAGLGGAEQRPTTEQARMLEMEADLKAGFYAYLAGYRPLEVAPQFLRAIYEAYRLDPGAAGTHPTLADRITITERVDSALTQLIDVFEGGVRLLVVGRYADASRVFDHIARSFPSREVLSNAGVARALWALELLGDSARYAYPFELDAESRLRTAGDRGFGFGADEHSLAQRLAREARELFEAAAARDPDYATAYVNLAAMYDVLGEHEVALALGGVAARVAERTGERATLAHARIVQGIAQAQLGRQADALASLQAASAGSPALAQTNQHIVRTGRRPEPDAAQREIVRPGMERIAGVGTDDQAQAQMQMPDVQLTLAAVDRHRPMIGLFGRRIDDAPALMVGDMSSLVFTVATPAGYRGESARGVRVGHGSAELQSRYGTPARVVAARQGTWHVYPLSRIAFAVDPAGTVTGWMIYHVEE